MILEACLPDLDGLQLQQMIKAEWPAVSIMFVAGVANVPMSVRAMKDGAIEFLTKPCPEEYVVTAVRSAAERCRKTRLIEAELNALRRRYARLTPREKVIFPLVAEGTANWKVGVELGISEITVKVHRANVMRKMSADSLGESHSDGPQTSATHQDRVCSTCSLSVSHPSRLPISSRNTHPPSNRTTSVPIKLSTS